MRYHTLILNIGGDDILSAERGSCTNCPIVRALKRWLTSGDWTFDGIFAENPMYGRYGLRERVGYDGGFDAIARYDAGESLSARQLVLVRCP